MNVDKLQQLKNKKVICSIYHIDFEKFSAEDKEEFNRREAFVDVYHVISEKTKLQLKELTDKIKEMSTSTATTQDAEEAEEEADENIDDLDDGSEEEGGFPWALLVGAAAVAAQLLG